MVTLHCRKCWIQAIADAFFENCSGQRNWISIERFNGYLLISGDILTQCTVTELLSEEKKDWHSLWGHNCVLTWESDVCGSLIWAFMGMCRATVATRMLSCRILYHQKSIFWHWNMLLIFCLAIFSHTSPRETMWCWIATGIAGHRHWFADKEEFPWT